MLFIRKTVRNVFLRSDRINSLSEYLVKNCNGKITAFEEGWKESDEFQTLLFLTRPGLTKTRIEDAETIIKIPEESSQILAKLFNMDACSLVYSVQLGAGIIIARVIGDGSDLEKMLSDRYKAESIDFRQAISKGEADDSILVFTNSSLAGKLTPEELVGKPMLIKENYLQLYRDLRKQGARLITQSLKDKQWYEMRINIYDSADHYEEHYERLQIIFSDLDIGMILGESWTRDHAMVMMSVLAYQVRLFSMEPPEKIKRILMGMEYNSSGSRFADMDLYYRNRKVSKNDKNIRKSKNETFKEIRDDLYDKLTPAAVKQLVKLEESISTGD